MKYAQVGLDFGDLMYFVGANCFAGKMNRTRGEFAVPTGERNEAAEFWGLRREFPEARVTFKNRKG